MADAEPKSVDCPWCKQPMCVVEPIRGARPRVELRCYNFECAVQPASRPFETLREAFTAWRVVRPGA